MTLKSFLSIAVAVVLTAGTAAVAQPTIAIDLVRNDADLPVLSDDGNFQFVVTATPGPLVEVDGEMDGDSLALNLGIEIATGSLISGSAITSAEQQGITLTNDGAPFTQDVDAFDTLIPSDIFFAFADPTSNASVTGAGVGDAFPLGIVEGNTGTVDAINVGIGSDEVTGTVDALFFETVGPSTTDGLTVSVNITSAFGAQAVTTTTAGTPGSVLVDLEGGASTLSFDATILAGDATLDGTVNAVDFDIVVGNLGSSDAIFTDGNFNLGVDDAVNAVDFDLVVSNLGTSDEAPAVISAAVVPEPAALALGLIATTGLIVNRRVRR